MKSFFKPKHTNYNKFKNYMAIASYIRPNVHINRAKTLVRKPNKTTTKTHTHTNTQSYRTVCTKTQKT